MTTSSPTLSRRDQIAWRNALFVVFAICGIGIASWASRIPAISDALDISTAEVGVLLLGGAIGSIAGLIAAGHLVATFGSRAVIRWTLMLLPVGIVIAALGASVFGIFGVTFAGLAIWGLAMGTCDVAMNVSGANNERALGKTVMPIYHAFFSFGTMAGAAVGAAAEALRIPLEIHLIGTGIVMATVALLSVRFLQNEPEDTSPAHDRQHRTWRGRLLIWRDPQTLLIGLIVLGMALAEGSANDWLAYAMVEGHGTDAATGALIFGVFVTAMTVGRLLGVRLLDRFGRVPVLRYSALLAFAGLLVVITTSIDWVIIVGVVFWGLGAALGFPVGMSAAADDPRTAAARVSAVATIGYVAFLVGPPIIGFLGERFGILNGLILVLVLIGVAGLVSPAAREPKPVTSSL